MATGGAVGGVVERAAAQTLLVAAVAQRIAVPRALGGTDDLAVVHVPAGVLLLGRRQHGAVAARRMARTHGTLVLLAVHDEHVGLVVRAVRQLRPVDRLCEAQLGILFDAHRPAANELERVQRHLLQVEHLEHDERVVVEEAAATDHRQVGEHATERLEAAHAKDQEEVGDLGEQGKCVVVEALAGLVVDQQDLEEALDHAALGQLLQLFGFVAHVHALADYEGGGKRETKRMINK